MGSPSTKKKFFFLGGGGQIFFTPFGLSAVQTFYNNRPCKGVSKTGLKILGLLQKFPGGGSGVKVSSDFVIFQLFHPFLHNRARYHQSENGLSNYRHFLTIWWKMVYFGPPWNTWSPLIRTRPMGGGIPTRRSRVEL